VPEDAQLEISFVGYEDKTLGVQAAMGEIALSAVTSDLQEVDVMVNTGYQQLPKERATGSFEFLDSTAINRIVSTNILDRLEGSSSLMFDKDPNRPGITLRGISTVEGNTKPLIILDNFPYEGDISSINPNDVQSI